MYEIETELKEIKLEIREIVVELNRIAQVLQENLNARGY